jgi:predicted enzyme related to lactoylglutathione lyase
MPTRDTPWPAGTPCWIDTSVPDLDTALEFYGSVIGWSFADTGAEFGHYRICQAGGRAAGGISSMMSPDQPHAWTVYFASDDVDGTVKLINDNGGTVLMPPMDVGDTCRIAIAQDSLGAVFGIFQGQKSIGTEVFGEPGALVWEDGRFTDVARGREFYAAVFGYTFEEIPGMPLEDYAAFKVGDNAVGGIGAMMGDPEGTPSHWTAYIEVEDVDAAVTAAWRGGGALTRPAQDTPFGRMASLIDPFGAAFAVHGPNNEAPDNEAPDNEDKEG